MTPEEKIADLKANFDYVLEGKDLEINELKDRLAEEVELHLHAEDYIKSLEQQIEKMKMCCNCKWLPMTNETINVCHKCKDKNMWELKND